jgi:cytochrome c-type biogenesis protein CcmF
MGGLWAYETLGWGGVWKWDPVENTSFVPWILMATLVHGMIVQTTRKRWLGTNLWLAALPFLSFAYGTFLTRSGFLTDVSVHSFAEMDKSALVILEILIGISVAAFAGVFFWKGLPAIRSTGSVDASPGFTRETAYGYGNLLLSLLALVIAIGMSWPFLLTKVMQRKAAVVEESLYHQVVVWFFIPIMLLMAVAPFISWRALPLRQVVGRFINVFSLSAGIAGFMMFGINRTVPMPADPTIGTPFGKLPLFPVIALLLFLCVFVAVSSLWRVSELVKRTRMSLGGFVAHFGVATIMAGLILSRGLESHQQGFVRDGESIKLLGYNVKPGDFTSELRDSKNKLVFEITSPDGKSQFKAYPGLYFRSGADGDNSAMVWPHIQRYLTHDVYLTLHEPIITAWKEPVWFKVGETKTVDGITVKYVGLHMQGEAGQQGTRFGAKLDLTIDGQNYHAMPEMVIGDSPTIPLINENFRVALAQMDAANRSVAIQVYFAGPVYPVELYYKPFTGLVWLGAGILFLGGMMSAFARRRPNISPPINDPEALMEGSDVEETENAPVPVA